MLHKATVEAQADSLLDLLIAQCADLEALLQLARREAEVAGQGNFEELLRVVSERATLGERLEICHRQITELRERLGETAENAGQNEMAARAAMLAGGILRQDEETRPLLMAARDRISAAAREAERKRRGLSAYLSDGRSHALACDQLA
ncbi:MAG TPA: hypothetical protein VNQ79_00775 [Blastocatellia bacterium]|nr:hypothetical protein [Blastocatellia bacterium]